MCDAGFRSAYALANGADPAVTWPSGPAGAGDGHRRRPGLPRLHLGPRRGARSRRRGCSRTGRRSATRRSTRRTTSGSRPTSGSAGADGDRFAAPPRAPRRLAGRARELARGARRRDRIPGCDGVEFDVRLSRDGVPVSPRRDAARVQRPAGPGATPRRGGASRRRASRPSPPCSPRSPPTLPRRRAQGRRARRSDRVRAPGGARRGAGAALVSSFEPADPGHDAQLLPGWRAGSTPRISRPATLSLAMGLGCRGSRCCGAGSPPPRSGVRRTPDWRSRPGRSAAPRPLSGSAGWASSRAVSRARRWAGRVAGPDGQRDSPGGSTVAPCDGSIAGRVADGVNRARGATSTSPGDRIVASCDRRTAGRVTPAVGDGRRRAKAGSARRDELPDGGDARRGERRAVPDDQLDGHLHRVRRVRSVLGVDRLDQLVDGELAQLGQRLADGGQRGRELGGLGQPVEARPPRAGPGSGCPGRLRRGARRARSGRSRRTARRSSGPRRAAGRTHRRRPPTTMTRSTSGPGSRPAPLSAASQPSRRSRASRHSSGPAMWAIRVRPSASRCSRREPRGALVVDPDRRERPRSARP